MRPDVWDVTLRGKVAIRDAAGACEWKLGVLESVATRDIVLVVDEKTKH